MNARIGCVLIVLAALAGPLRADLGGITTTPANLPSPPREMVGGGGFVWILTTGGNLGKLAPGGAYTEFPLQLGNAPSGVPNAANLAYGADGNVWVIGYNGHIERVTPSGNVTDFTVTPTPLSFIGIAAGADTAIWFFACPTLGPPPNPTKMGRIDIYGQITTYDLGLGQDTLTGLVSGGNGGLWFIDTSKDQVVRFSVASQSIAGTYAIPSASNLNGDNQTVLGLDGNVWFTRGTGIDRVTPDGTITEFKTPSGGQTNGIAVGSHGDIWFTEYTAGKLGQFVLSSITSGGSATINESAAVLPGGEKLLVVPAAFAPVASGKVGTLAATPCDLTYLVKKTPPTAGIWVTWKDLEPCSDVQTTLTTRIEGVLPTLWLKITVYNAGPDPANTVTAVYNQNSSLVLKNTTAGPDVTLTVSDEGIIAKKSTLDVGKSFTVSSSVSSSILPFPPVGGTVVAFSLDADPDVTNNVASFTTFLQGERAPLPPDISGAVLGPVQRGGH